MQPGQFPDYDPRFNPATANLSAIRPGDILVMHDSVGTVANTLNLLGRILVDCPEVFKYPVIPDLQNNHFGQIQ